MRVLGLALAACAVLALSAAPVSADAKDKKSNADKILGSWTLTKAGDKPVPVSVVVEFLKGGKLKVNVKDPMGKTLSLNGTYKIEGDKITITSKGPDGKEKTETETITTLTDTKLVTKDDKGKTSEFKKK